MKRFRTILFLSSVFVLLLLVLRWSSVAANSGLSNRFSPTFISFKHEVEFRRSIGFKSNETHIKVVHAASDSIFVESLGGIALTPAEFEELQIRLDVEKDVDTILEFFKTSPELQDAFGGIYIEHFAGAEDHSKGGKLVLQLVAGHIQSEDVFHGLNLQRPDRLQVEWVRFSQEELQEQYDRLVLSSSTVFQGLFMHTKLNRVGVIVDLPLERNELQEPLSKEFLPDNLLQLVTHPAIVVYNGRIEVEQIALRGGDVWSKVPNGVGRCTVGFKVKDNVSRRYGIVTAGHCITGLDLQIGNKVYSRSKTIGTVSSYIDGASSPYGAGVDAAFIRTLRSNTSTDDVNYFTSYFDIVGETSDYTIGRIRCFTGAISGTKCSPITCQNQEYNQGGKYYNRLFTVDADPIQGDSGSPVYEVVGQTDTVMVTGVLGTRMSGPACMNGWDGGASRWEDVKNYLNLSLIITR